jgi:hypothetical protein
MSNTIIIGASSGGNTLYLTLANGTAIGAAGGTSSATGQALTNRANGTAAGSSIVLGAGTLIGVAVGVGNSLGSSIVAGLSLTNRADGSSIGSSTVLGSGNILTVVLANGIAIGSSFTSGISLTNRAIGLAAGTSLAQYLVQFAGSAVGTSTVIGVADAASKFKPLDLFVGYSSDGTSITIPISSVIGLTAEEADVTTGDWREVLQAILLRAVEHHRSFTWSEQLRTYNAFGMNQLNNSTYNRYFSTTFYTHQCGANVVQEP